MAGWVSRSSTSGNSDTDMLVRRAYEAKYRDQPRALEPMVAPTAAETTLRVTAAG